MAYCTITDIQDLMSDLGVIAASDDSITAITANTTSVNNAIQRAESKINLALSQRYDTTLLTSASYWLKWCSATFSAVELWRRRGQPIPAGLQAEYDDYKFQLDQIVAEQLSLDGAAVPLTEAGVTMSNVVLDRRFRRTTQRTQTVISVGAVASTKTRNTEQYFGYEQ